MEEEKTAFVEFINLNLANDKDLEGVVPVDSSGDEIYDKVKDGLILLKMIDCAKPGTNDPRAINGPDKLYKGLENMRKYRMQENVMLCINSAKAIGCSVVNIGAADIIEGNHMIIFALMWQIIRIKLTAQINLVHHPELFRLLEEGETLEDFLKLPPEHILLRWFNYHLKGAGHPRRVTNFTTDVKDGENYTVLLHKIAPEHCDLEGLKEEDPVKRADIILTNAEKLGVKRFITPKDIASGNNRLNFSFTAELFNHWPALAPLENLDDKLKILLDEDDSAENREERAYRNWINNVGIETYCNNLFSDLQDGIVFTQLMEKLKPGKLDTHKINKNLDPKKATYKFKKNENNKYAIDTATKEFGVSLVGIGGSDLSEGNHKSILAFVWQLRRLYVLDYLNKLGEKTGKKYDEKSLLDEANEKVRAAGKSSMIKGYDDPAIKTSRFLWDLIGTIEPRAIDEELYRSGSSEEDGGEKKDNEMNAKYAIAAARKIGCSIFCLWEDIVEANKKMMLTMIGAIMAEGHKVEGE